MGDDNKEIALGLGSSKTASRTCRLGDVSPLGEWAIGSSQSGLLAVSVLLCSAAFRSVGGSKWPVAGPVADSERWKQRQIPHHSRARLHNGASGNRNRLTVSAWRSVDWESVGRSVTTRVRARL